MHRAPPGRARRCVMKPPSRSSRATGPKMRVPRGLSAVVDDHRGVLVEGDVGAVVAPELLLRAHDDRLDDLALLDRALRVRLLDGRGDDVAHARVAAARAAHHADAEDLAGAGVVGDLEACLVLDHYLRASRARRSRRQRLVRDIGRHSTTRTVSPDARVVALVVGVQLRRGAHDLAVAPVAAGDVDAHDDRLVGLVGDDDALAHLRRGRGRARARRRARARARPCAPLGGLRLRALRGRRGAAWPSGRGARGARRRAPRASAGRGAARRLARRARRARRSFGARATLLRLGGAARSLGRRRPRRRPRRRRPRGLARALLGRGLGDLLLDGVGGLLGVSWSLALRQPSAQSLRVSSVTVTLESIPRWCATVRARARSRLRSRRPGGVLQLAGGVLHAQAEQVAARGRDAASRRRVVGDVSQLARLHPTNPSSRMTNLVLTGSLWPARRIASRASCSSHAGELEHHAARLDDGDPALRVALAGAHAGLGRLLGERLVRIDVDPDLAATLDLARHRDTSGLDLAVGEPAGLEGLEAVLAELRPVCWPRENPALRPRCCLRNLTRFGDSISARSLR